MSTATTIFTLFLVTYAADVKHSTYDSLQACEEAKSLAVYGKTIEKKRIDDATEVKRAHDEDIARQQALLKKYPPRKATPDEIKEAAESNGQLYSLSQSNLVSFRVEEGLVVPHDSVWFSSGVSFDLRQSGDAIKTAECVIVPKDRAP